MRKLIQPRSIQHFETRIYHSSCSSTNLVYLCNLRSVFLVIVWLVLCWRMASKVKQTCSKTPQNRNTRTKTTSIVIICLLEARRMIFTIRTCLFVKVMDFRTPNHQLVLKRLHPGSTNRRKLFIFNFPAKYARHQSVTSTTEREDFSWKMR